MSEREPQIYEERRLAAIVFIDMVGYSALMQVSELRAEAAVRTLWDMARPILQAQGGREVRRFGDGMLIEFGSTVAAVQSCVALLEQLAQRNRDVPTASQIGMRASINLGEIGGRGENIYGDGINIAARLVALAPQGGVAITPHVREQIANVLDHPVKSLGVKLLKNIRAPIELFCLPGPECGPADLAAAAAAGEIPVRCWRFGTAAYDERSMELSVGAKLAPLDRKATLALQHLLQHAGEVVTEDELGGACGADSDAELETIIAQLWEALRDADQKQIRRQPGFGYRLAVPVVVEAAPDPVTTQFNFVPGDHPPLRPLWNLSKLLGAGGHGEVWLVRHSKTGEDRVFKFALDPSRLISLKREITLSRLLHSTVRSEHFIRVLDWNLEFPPYFIECEYGGTNSLSEWALAQGGLTTLDLDQRIDIAAQIAEALAAAHSVGVLHKDLKPANILVAQRAGEPLKIKLADFGSGGVLNTGLLEDIGITRMGFTQTVLDLGSDSSGTAMYLAPERLAGQPATVQGDVYALGVLLYQLVIGDFKKLLTAGWDSGVEDELLREDIADAAHGNPEKRIADAATLARRLRALDARRRQRAQDRRIAAEAEHDRQRLERWKLRRIWMGLAATALIGGTVVSLVLYREAVRQRDIATAITEFMTKDFFSDDSAGQRALRDMNVGELVERGAQVVGRKFEQQPEIAGRLHALFSYVHGSISSSGQKSIEQQEAAVAALERAYGRASEVTMVEILSLAHLYENDDMSGRAAPLLQEVRAYRNEHPGTAYETARLERELIVHEYKLGNYQVALPMARALLDRIKDERSERYRNIFPVLFYSLAGMVTDPVESEAHARLAIKIAGDQKNQFVAGYHRDLGLALRRQGRYSEAEQAYLKAIDYVNAFEKTSRSLMATAYNEELCIVYLLQGRRRELIELYESVLTQLDFYERPVAENIYPYYAAKKAGVLAAAYAQEGRPDQAVRVMQAVMKFIRANEKTIASAPFYADLAALARPELANALRSDGQLEKAAQVLQDNESEVAKLNNEVVTAHQRYAEGMLALARKDPDQARAKLTEAIRVAEAAKKPDKWYLPQWRRELADLPEA